MERACRVIGVGVGVERTITVGKLADLTPCGIPLPRDTFMSLSPLGVQLPR